MDCRRYVHGYLKADWLQLIGAWVMRLMIWIVISLPILGLAQSSDEIAVRALIDNFFVAMEKKDMTSLVAMFDVKAPGFEATKQRMQRLFTNNEGIEISKSIIRKLDIDGAKGTARVSMEMTAVDVQTKAPADRFGKMDFLFRVVKAEGTWKVSQFVPTVEDLAEES
jgi:hypothetical protein